MSDLLHPTMHKVGYRYLLKTRDSAFSPISEGVLLEWSPQGRAKVKWVEGSAVWFDIHDMPLVIETLNKVESVLK